MNPLSSAMIKKRSAFFQHVREFFLNRGYLEVDTPHLVRHPSLEPHLDPYEVSLNARESGVLITSPEFSLKKMLSREMPKIFELAHCYRGEEPGPWHTNEFRMLEWYTLPQTIEELIEQCKDLFDHLLPGLKTHVFTTETWFMRQFGHGTKPADMQRTLTQQGVENTNKMDACEMFFRLFLPTESQLADLGLVFLTDYPAEQCAYAKVEGGVAKRFEIYLHGVEVANAYLEETRPDRLRAQLTKEQHERKLLGKPTFEQDREFIDALIEFEEPICGIAMGLDRVFALQQGLDSLTACSPFENFSRSS